MSAPTAMKLHLVFPALPPTLDGIGDYTARLAAALQARQHEVKVFTAQEAFDEVPGVAVQRAFAIRPPRATRRLFDAVRRDPPDWLVVQYNPFSYGRWGLNPYLPLVLQRIKRRCPRMRIAVMVHEPFVPVESWSTALMTTWQRGQLWLLGQTSDLVFFSIAPWAERFRRWFPGTPVHHLPVSSNVPRTSAPRQAVREEIGLAPDDFVVGVFGGAHPSRLLHFVRAAVEAVQADVRALRVLYVGAAGTRVRDALGDAALIDAGALPAAEVSRHFAAMDLYLAPFRKGVSTRRGSFLVGLQHGVATVSTRGIHTDAALLDADGSAFLLASDDDSSGYGRLASALAQDEARRSRIGRTGETLFQTSFCWPRIADTLLTALEEVRAPAPALLKT